MNNRHFAAALVLLAYGVAVCGCSRQMPQEATSVAEDRHATTHVHQQAATAPESPARQHDELSGQLADGVREVRVEAFKFGFKPDPIVVKKGEQVRIIAESTDVKHGLGIADFSINVELPPDQEKAVEFTPDKAGEFHIHCTVYCGSGHGDMHGTLLVIE